MITYIDVKLDDLHCYECGTIIIARKNENRASALRLHLTDEMLDKNIYVEIKKADNSKFISSALTINQSEKTAIFEFTNQITGVAGEIVVDIVIRDGNNLDWKTFRKKYLIDDAICASEAIQEDLVDFIDEAQAKLDEVDNLDIEANKSGSVATITVTKKDGTIESIEINDGTDGQNGRDGLTTSVNGIEQVNGNIDIDLDNIQDGTNRKIPTSTSELANDSGFITNAVNNLTNYYLKTEADNSLSNKVDKETGKSLIADTEITRLSSVHNYDDTEVTADIAALEGSKVDKEIGKGLSTNDYTTTEKTKLSGIEAGAEVNTVDSVNGQTGAVVIDIPTKTSDLTNDSGFIDKEVSDLTNYVKNTDFATTAKAGLVRKSVPAVSGLSIDGNGYIGISKASEVYIDGKTNSYMPIVPANLNYAVRSVRPANANTATTIEVNTIYDLGEQTSITINLPTGQLGDFIQVDFLSTATPTTLTITATSSALSDLDLVPEANKIYSLFFVYGRLETAVYGWKIAFSENTRTVI